MDPSAPNPKLREERENTDESLRVERSKADAELADALALDEQGAERLLEVARQHAEAMIRAANDRAATADMTAKRQRVLALERAAEDKLLAEERAAEERLHAERAARQEALSELLRTEREVTDEMLDTERARADAAVMTRDDFLGIVSHDLRTMLGVVSLSATIVAKLADREGEGAAEIKKHSDRIQRFVGRMNGLVGDLLDVVSLDAGRLDVKPRPLDASALVRQSLEAFQPSFAARDIALTADGATGEVVASFDHERMLQVLSNLLSNALKFTEPGGAVKVALDRDGADVRISVIDTGPGIPAGQETVIFERFRQVGPRDRRGLGLGLYISKCIVEAHGGRIWAESPGARGTAVRFTLPAAPDR